MCIGAFNDRHGLPATTLENRMLRFVIRRRELDRYTGLATENMETVDANCEDLERVLRVGGQDDGAYDHREVAGVELLPDAGPVFTAQEVADACTAAEIPDSKCESLLLALPPSV